MTREQRIKELEAQIAANTAELEELKAEPKLVRCPEGVLADIEEGAMYRYVDSYGHIGEWGRFNPCNGRDVVRLKIGNCFRMNEAGVKAALTVHGCRSFYNHQFQHLYNIGVVAEVAEPITITFKAYPISVPIPEGSFVRYFDDFGWGGELDSATHWAYADDMKPKGEVPE